MNEPQNVTMMDFNGEFRALLEAIGNSIVIGAIVLTVLVVGLIVAMFFLNRTEAQPVPVKDDADRRR